MPRDAIQHVLTKHQYDGIDFDWKSTRIPESKKMLMCTSIVYCKCILALDFTCTHDDDDDDDIS